MQITLKKDLLLKAVNITEKNIGRNLSLPVLNNILIKTEDKSLEVISTDLEMGIRVSIPAKIDKEGSIALQPRILSGLLNNLTEENLNIKIEKNTLFIEQGDYKTSIKGEDDKEFPLLPNVPKKDTFEVSAPILTGAFEQLINSTATSDLKPELTGILFNFSKTDLRLAATDSFRLAEKTISHKNNIKGNKKFILPSKTASEIMRSFSEIEGDLVIYIDENQVSVTNKENQKTNIQLVSKLIEGEYPEYTQIIPQEFQTKTTVSKKEFTQQVKAAGLFASRINDIKLEINNNKITISSENNDIGKFQASVEASIEGDKKTTTFNYQYLLDGLNNIEGDEVVFKINKEDGPTLLESINQKNYFYVLMPLRS